MLLAPNKAEKEMWVHAFNTILKYKRKADEHKHHPNEEVKQPIKDQKQQLELGREDEGFEDPEEEEFEDEEEDKYEDQDQGDFMEDNRQPQRVIRDKPSTNQHHHSTSDEDADLHPQSQELGQRHRRFQVARKKSSEDPNISKDSQEERKQEVEERIKEERNRQRELGIRHQQEEVERRGVRKSSAKRRRDSPEVLDADSPDSQRSDSREKENIEHHRPKKADKKSKKSKTNDIDNNIELDIDKIIKSGPKETIRLAPPSPPNNQQKESDEPPAYFTGFVGHPKKHETQAQKQLVKKKPMIKASNIVK